MRRLKKVNTDTRWIRSFSRDKLVFLIINGNNREISMNLITLIILYNHQRSA